MEWHEAVIDVFTGAVDECYHAAMLPRSVTSPEQYLLWMEYPHEDMMADGKHTETKVRGTADLYTLTEFDPIIKTIESAMENSGFMAWRMSYIDHEDNTGYWHYEWEWEAAGWQGYVLRA